MATRGVFGAVIKVIGTVPRILLLQRKGNGDGTGYPDEWELPGGRANDGESDIDCLSRRVYEETNIWVNSLGQISPDLQAPPGIVTAQSDDACVHLCLPREGDLKHFPTESHKDAKWVTVHEIFNGTFQVLTNPTSKGYISRMMKMILAGFNAHQIKP